MKFPNVSSIQVLLQKSSLLSRHAGVLLLVLRNAPKVTSKCGNFVDYYNELTVVVPLNVASRANLKFRHF